MPTSRLAKSGLFIPKGYLLERNMRSSASRKAVYWKGWALCRHIIYMLRPYLSPTDSKGKVKSGCLQHVKHWRMRDLTGFIRILLPACMLRVIDTKQTVRYLLPQAATPCPPPKRGLLALRFTQQSAKSPHWRRYLDDFAYTCSFNCKPSGVMSGKRFSVQIYCGREERHVPPVLSAGGLDGSLPQISACLGNLGIPSALSRLTPVLSSLLSAVELRTENGFPGHEDLRGFTKGKRIETKNIQKTSEYACKKNDNRTRTEGRH